MSRFHEYDLPVYRQPKQERQDKQRKNRKLRFGRKRRKLIAFLLIILLIGVLLFIYFQRNNISIGSNGAYLPSLASNITADSITSRLCH